MKYYLINEKGKKFEINDLKNTVFNLTSDLGTSKNVEYVQVGKSFLKVKEEKEQGKIEGKLTFIKNAEQIYKDFVYYIRTSQDLTFVNIRGNEEYLVDIEYTKIGRKEERGSLLVSELSFCCVTNWYKQKNVIYTIAGNEDAFGFPIFFHSSKFGNGSIDNLVINNEGYEEAPFYMLISGPLIDPKIELLVDSKIINTITLNLRLEEFEKVEYSSKDDELYIRKIKSDGTYENLFDILDINNNNFFKAPLGSSYLRISADTNINYAKIIAYIQY